MRQRAIVDVSAGDDARGRDRLTGGAALHHQRRPFGDLAAVLAVLHALDSNDAPTSPRTAS